MNHTLRRTFYWHHMGADVDCIVRNCTSCVWNSPTYCHICDMHLFMANGLLEFIAMDSVCLLPETMRGSQYILIVTGSYSKQTQAVPTSRTTAPQVANMFMDQWLVPYSTLLYLLTDNGAQYVSRFFATVYAQFGVKHLATKAGHSRTNSQAKRFSKAILTCL